MQAFGAGWVLRRAGFKKLNPTTATGGRLLIGKP